MDVLPTVQIWTSVSSVPSLAPPSAKYSMLIETEAECDPNVNWFDSVVTGGDAVEVNRVMLSVLFDILMNANTLGRVFRRS